MTALPYKGPSPFIYCHLVHPVSGRTGSRNLVFYRYEIKFNIYWSIFYIITIYIQNRNISKLYRIKSINIYYNMQ